MPTPLPSPFKTLAAAAALVVLSGCQPGTNPRPVPSVAQIGSNLKCPAGDDPLSDFQAGWGFCHPDAWRYVEKSQGSQSPPGLDLTFDVYWYTAVKAPCPSPSPLPSGASPLPQASPCYGDFAFMIISTYERGSSTSIAGWVQANMPGTPAGESISWGNSVEAVKLPDGRRIALTPHHIVILELHNGLLNLESAMAPRLGTWKFVY
jgi:hypothetical protein